jgi:DNA-binding LytR/AlgR family response regulator
MDTEEFLRDLGIAEVVTASSVKAADEAMAREQFDLAILDFNLGAENSIELAERLSAAGTPLAFATGYGDAISSIATVPHLAVLKKPYSSSDLSGLLALASSAE